MSDIHGNQTKWGCSDPERYGLTDPNAGILCKDCGGSGFVDNPANPDLPIRPCPDCGGTGRPR